MSIKTAYAKTIWYTCRWLQNNLKLLTISKIYTILYKIYGVYVLLFALEFVYKECCSGIVEVIFFSLLPLKVILMGLISIGIYILCKSSVEVESYDELSSYFRYYHEEMFGGRSTLFGYIVRSMLYLTVFTHTVLNTFHEGQDGAASFGRLILLIILINIFNLLLVWEKAKCRFIVRDITLAFPIKYIPIFRPWSFTRLLYILTVFVLEKKSVFRSILLILMFIFSYVFVAAVIFALFMICPISWEQFSSLFTRLPFLG